MSLSFYDFKEIAVAADCREIAVELYGCTIKHGRCAARWRGGDGDDHVEITKDWYNDYPDNDKGGVIKLAAFKFSGDIQQAQRFLGEKYRLTPKLRTVKGPRPPCRYDELIASGYRETRRDVYHNLDGTPAHFEVRLDHPDSEKFKKQYLMGHGDQWGLEGVPLVLFNLPAISKESWCCIVEGPKCACCLIERNIPATTCCGGSKKWRHEYSEYLRGKHVAILFDNDAPGRAHADTVAAALQVIAAGIRLVPTSTAPKGDVYDFIAKEGHTAADVLALIQQARPWTPPATLSFNNGGDETPQELLTDAKQANTEPFRNHIPKEGEKIVRGKPVKEIVNEPRTHADMLRDLNRRFLGFPRKIGNEHMFDHDRASGEIVNIPNPEHLIAWIGRRSSKVVPWARGDAMVTPGQFFASILATCPRYEAISGTPDWPKRKDIYYTHAKLPLPCPDLSRFKKLCDFFLPASETDKLLIRALFCSPLWYVPGIPRPSWIIDSKDAQGSGKTTLVETAAFLYGSSAISTSKQEIDHDESRLTRRILSQSGRAARVLLVDNVTGAFNSGALAALITRRDITGMSPYGHGEETRPNNLTYAITVNTATFSDNDIPSRSFYIYVRRPDAELDEKSWKEKIEEYIGHYRLEIISDIIHMLSTHKRFPGVPTQTRFPEFERSILQPCCETPDNLFSVLDNVKAARADSNTEEEQARAINEVFEFELQSIGITGPAFLRTEIVNSWGRRALHETIDFKGYPIQLIRNLSKGGHLPLFDCDSRRINICNGKERCSGIGYRMTDTTTAFHLVTRDAGGIVSSRLVEIEFNFGVKSTRMLSLQPKPDQPKPDQPKPENDNGQCHHTHHTRHSVSETPF